MRMRIDPPVTDLQQQGAFHVAHMSLRHQNEIIDSGPCRAAVKKTAEQLAAQALLDVVSTRDVAGEVVHVSEDDNIRLQSNNPKGTLLEWCAKQKIPPPSFEQGASPAGYRVRGQLSLNAGQDIFTPWYVAKKLKMGEQAAAERILWQLPDEPITAQCDSPISPQIQEQPLPQPAEGPGAAMVLNELRQVGILQDIGYEVLDQTGPSHQPTFSVIAWATTLEGHTHSSQPVQASSKKSGQRLAADRLLDLLVAAGITRR